MSANNLISKKIKHKSKSLLLLPLLVLILLLQFQNCSSGVSPTTSNTNDTNNDSTDSTNSTSAYNSPTLISNLSSVYATEGNSATVTLTLSETHSSNISFMYQTYDGTAISGTNYNETSGVITVPADSLLATITLQTIDQSTNDGTLYFYIKVGQLDLSQDNYTTSVVRILDSDSSTSTSTGYSQLATGLYHTCGINSSSSLHCWGYNNYGQLGDGSTASISTPQAVSGLSSDITSVATGAYHSCAIAGGALKCWGHNNKGQLGDGTLSDRSSPIAVTGLSSGITQVSAGYSHVCAIQSGALYCWGNNTNGQLGDGTKTNQSLPQLVSGMESSVSSVAAGYNYTCAIQSQMLKCWGNNSNGQLGTSDTTAHIAPFYTGISNASQVFINLVTTCLITTENALSCWGYNGYGQVGTSSTTGSITAPNTVHGSGVESVSRGHGYHVCGISNSSAYCWGYNYYGELGTGNTTNKNSPSLISF